jgi:hypothetical protein
MRFGELVYLVTDCKWKAMPGLPAFGGQPAALARIDAPLRTSSWVAGNT